uniref:Odorant receptor n=1 Tax=Locusta migratoria TaxID=7004 RepID=A0A0M3SBP8_LOCMI|nr:odorant receptor 62 [Locusta migratoria]
MKQSASLEDCSPLTWEYTQQSLLKLNIRLLWALGVWPLPGSWVFSLLKVWLAALAVGNAVENVLGVWKNWGDLTEVTYSLLNAFTIGAGVAKTWHLSRYQPRYCLLVRRVDRLTRSQRRYCDGDAAMRAVTLGCRRTARRVTLSAFAYLTALCLIWMFMPLVAHPGERLLPFNHIPWEPRRFPLFYELSYAVQSASSVVYVFISFALDCFFAVVMIFLTEQLMVLNLRIRQLYARRDGDGSVLVAKQHSDKTVLDKHEEMYKELCLCIDTHQDIIRLLSFLDAVMNPIVLTQFMLSVMAACVTLFLESYSPDSSSVLNSISYLPTPGIQVYLYCWSAHNVLEEGFAVSEAAYGCAWYEGGGRFKRALRIVMCRAQKPLVVTAGRLYPVSRATFVSLVNASYTYYALLSRVHNRG